MKMKNAIRLVDYTEAQIERGHIIRCKGSYPYESIVDFLVCDSFLSTREGCRLVVASGYKAGLTYCLFPEESLPDGFASGLSVSWLVSNFSQYFPELSVKEVWVVSGYLPEIPAT